MADVEIGVSAFGSQVLRIRLIRYESRAFVGRFVYAMRPAIVRLELHAVRERTAQREEQSVEVRVHIRLNEVDRPEHRIVGV